MKYPRDIPPYAEIGIATNFSFLYGGSHPQEYVHQASELRLPVIGIADRNTLAPTRSWETPRFVISRGC